MKRHCLRLIVLLLLMVGAAACAPDCLWSAKAQAWIDENGNGLWDTGELPLRNVMFYVDNVRYKLEDVAENAVSDSNGQAQLTVWLPGYTCEGFEVYAEAPANYEATTPERVADAGQELFQFGYRYRAGAPTPTPVPVASLACTPYRLAREGWLDYQMDVEVAPDGDVWVATNEDVHRFSGPEPTHTIYKTEDGLPDYTARVVTIGPDGTVWVGTNKGAARFDGQAWTPYTTTVGLADGTVDDIAIDAAGTLWFSTHYGISTFSPGRDAWLTNAIDFEVVRHWPVGTPIEATPGGSLWFFPYDEVYQLEPAKMHGNSPVGASDLRRVEGFPAMTNIRGATMGNGLLWVFGWGEKGPALVRFNPATGQGAVYDHGTTGGAMFGGAITDVAVAPDGSVWLACGEEDMAAVHFIPGGDDPTAGTWIEYGAKNGLALGAMSSVAVEPGGAVWFGTDDGTVARCTENGTSAATVLPAGTPAPTTTIQKAQPSPWPIPPLAPEEVLAVMRCDLENLPAQRYPESMAAPDLLTAYVPQTDCDWAILAVAYADRRGENEPLSEAAQRAYTQAVARNPGFALADPLFYRYFGAVPMVQPPAFAEQEITDVKIAYRWQGLGDKVAYTVEIHQANTAPVVTSAYSDTLTTDKRTVQALARALSDLMPVDAEFQLQPCYDNYPAWSVTVTFADGTVTQLTTDSNFLHIGGPWFTEINGQVYLQVSTVFAEAVGKLIESLSLPLGEPEAMSCFYRPVLDEAFPWIERPPTPIPSLTTAPTPKSTKTVAATQTPGGPTSTPWSAPPNAEHPGWTNYTTANGLASNSVSAVAVAPDGTVWFGTAGGGGGGGASRFDGTTWTSYWEADGLVSNNVSDIAIAPDGAVWFGTYDGGASRFDGERWTGYSSGELAATLVWDIAVGPAPQGGTGGTMWFGTIMGASRFDGRAWTTYTTADGLPSNNVRAVAVAPDGAVWFGAAGGGATRFDGKTWTSYTIADGLAGDEVSVIVVAPDGAVWAGTGGGTSRFDGKTWTTYTAADGLASNKVLAIAVGPDGVVWFGTNGGVSRFDGKTWTTYTTADGLADNSVGAIAIGPDGAVWFGMGSGVSRYLPPR
jgi:ligand-binding sensor domain-containing protein